MTTKNILTLWALLCPLVLAHLQDETSLLQVNAAVQAGNAPDGGESMLSQSALGQGREFRKAAKAAGMEEHNAIGWNWLANRKLASNADINAAGHNNVAGIDADGPQVFSGYQISGQGTELLESKAKTKWPCGWRGCGPWGGGWRPGWGGGGWGPGWGNPYRNPYGGWHPGWGGGYHPGWGSPYAGITWCSATAAAVNTVPCKCGATTCAANNICSAGVCTAAACTTVDGSAISTTYPCKCGVATCQSNTKCNSAGGSCVEVACLATDNTVIEVNGPCKCTTNNGGAGAGTLAQTYCAANDVCYAAGDNGATVTNLGCKPQCPVLTSANAVVTAICHCGLTAGSGGGAATCAAGQTCTVNGNNVGACSSR